MFYLYLYKDLPKKVECKTKEDYAKHIFLSTEKDIPFDAKIKYKGRLYCGCCRQKIDNDFYFGVKEFEVKNICDIDTEYESEITCPVCGHKHSDSYEEEESDDDCYCEQCGALFEYERQVTVEYVSKLVKLNEDFIEL